MAKKHGKPAMRDSRHSSREADRPADITKPANSLKDLLSEDALAKLKNLEREVKLAKEREAAEEAERRRREQEERERNKSFAELLAEYDKKGMGKYSS